MNHSLPQAVNTLTMRFFNTIPGSEDQRYSAIIMANSIGTKTLYAGEGYSKIGLVPKTDQDFVTAIYIKNAAGIDVTMGAVYFKFVPATAEVIASIVDLPRGLILEAKDDNKFDLTISSLR